MNNHRKQSVFRLPLPIIAFADWLLVLPATALLAATALRLLQSVQHEPARTAQLLLQWAEANIHTPIAAALLFLALPTIGIALGVVGLLRVWRTDVSLREEVVIAFALVRRRLWVGLLAGAVCLATARLGAVIAHTITD